MKQIRYIIALAAAAVLLTVGFFVVDHYTKTQQAEKNKNGPKVLFSFNSADATRITFDNSDGHFAFDWNTETGFWKLVSAEQFHTSTYTVSAVCNYFCELSSLRTIEEECTDQEIYGFDNPVTIQIYTRQTGTENPYRLLIGDATPTNDAFYAMVGGSNEVYTIDYTAGTIFRLSKDALKNTYILDTYGSLVDYCKIERDGKVIMEFQRDSDRVWSLCQPAKMAVQVSEVDNLMDLIVHTTVAAFIEENPADLKKYGLDNPHTKMTLRGTYGSENLATEIWLGDPVSSAESETRIYGYAAETKQVFAIQRGDVSYTKNPVVNYLYPFCIDVQIEDLSSIEVDMGSVYDLHETLYLNYKDAQYALGSTDIDALDDENISTLFQNFYVAINSLRISDTDFEASPSGEAAMSIKYTFNDGTTRLLEFIPQAENNFYIMQDGVYTNLTIRLNRFTSSGNLTKAYEELTFALKNKTN